MKARRFVTSLAVSAMLLIAGPTTSALAAPNPTDPNMSPPAPARPADLPGICGTLFGAGLSAASLGQQIAARGAGWIGAIVAAGCLLHDIGEYSREYALSPEGIAAFKEIQAKYGRYTFEDYMREFDCKHIDVPDRGGADGARISMGPGYWDCRGYGD